MSILMLLLLVGLVVLAGREARLDKTPMKPWSWSRPERDWWTHRRTRRERARSLVAFGGEKR